MSATITVEGRAIGGRRPLFPDFDLDLSSGDMTAIPTTLRELITHIVKDEVKAFSERQESRRLVRALSQADILQCLMKGKVDAGGRDLEQLVDEEEAVTTALQAFEDGVYYVFVDDVQKTDLDVPFTLVSGARLTFLRLVALAGG